MSQTWPVNVWQNCYRDSWKGILVPEAFSHPAKYSRALIRRIYEYMIDRGWLAPGDTVIDPFGGVACGAFDALDLGLHYRGCEIESRFVSLAEQNLAKWRGEMECHPRAGTAEIRQGDSRKLSQVWGLGDGVVSSPPYAETRIDGQGDEGASGLRNPDGSFVRGPEGWQIRKAQGGRYGDQPEQLGNLRDAGFDAAVASPPFGEAQSGGGINVKGYGDDGADKVGDRTYGDQTAGLSPDNLDSMNVMQGFDASVGSPPFESGQPIANPAETYKGFEHVGSVKQKQDGYGQTENQLGNESGETFWGASRDILLELHRALKPGAVAAWVCKDFVRKKQRVPFSDQWRQLCEACGFEMVEWVQASLVSDGGTQLGLFGEDVRLTTERKSFFRRLAEAKGSPRIDEEDVLFLRKPM